MKIILMRHGKPTLAKSKWISSVDMQHWIESYDKSVVQAQAIPAQSVQLANVATLIISSTAPRALSSLMQLARTADIVDAIYCEAPLPYALWRFPHLPPWLWAIVFRVLWFLGYARGAESIQMTSKRAFRRSKINCAVGARNRAIAWPWHYESLDCQGTRTFRLDWRRLAAKYLLERQYL